MPLSSAIPKLTLAIAVPERPATLVKREHNRIAKDALRTVLETHHKKRIPGHFEHSAHSKYGYKPRSPKYIRYKVKAFKTGDDLVMSGATQQKMIREPQFVMSGAAEGAQKKLGGKIVLRFAFGQSAQASYAKRAGYVQHKNSKRPPKRPGVDIAQMRKEIQAMTPAERREMAEQFRAEYLRLYDRLETLRTTYGVSNATTRLQLL